MNETTSLTLPPAASREGLTSLETARLQMAFLWTYGSVMIVVLLAIRTVSQPDVAQSLWTWALPTFLPTAGLIFSVLGSTAIVPRSEVADMLFVRRGFFKLARVVSFFYLLTLVLWITVAAPVIAGQSSLFTEPARVRQVQFGTRPDAAPPAAKTAAAAQEESEYVKALLVGNCFLTPLQTLVVGLISAMFFSTQKAREMEMSTAPDQAARPKDPAAA